ncbi:hypothetical protein FZW96_07965 [Bacillus sp. BGMRC 2118]|nr:hypothetical protein FZW96_07965 [Bacillus sp. BGMRC 2118]
MGEDVLTKEQLEIYSKEVTIMDEVEKITFKTTYFYVSLYIDSENKDNHRLELTWHEVGNKLLITLEGKQLRDRLSVLLDPNENGNSSYELTLINNYIEYEYKVYITQNTTLNMKLGNIYELYSILKVVNRYI